MFIGPPEKLPPWISEYSDSIGRTGQVIIDQKLHYKKIRKINSNNDYGTLKNKSNIVHTVQYK